MKRVYKLVNPQVRRNAVDAVLHAPDDFMVAISEPNRSLDQNAAQWPILQAFSDQLHWPVNGDIVQLSPDEWKDILTAAFERESVRLAEGLEGGVVMLGSRTSHFGKRKFSDWLEFLHATAAARGVVVYPEEASA
jgi:2-phospho-L-lactate guanylyltransferase (CobY/MobA/RfbA family)